MKKSIIAAGAASVALAAMPVVGVFAVKSTDTANDTLHLTLSPTCTLSTTSHTPAGGAWTGNTLNKTISADTLVELGSTTFTVVCNDTSGWGVTASAETLDGQTESSEKFTVGDPSSASGVYSYTASTTETSGITATGMNNTFSVTGAGVTGAGKTFVVTYNAKANSATQSNQVYEGTITYTLSSVSDM